MTLTELRSYLIELAIKTYNNQYFLNRKYEDFDIITISHKNFKYAFEVFAKAKEDPLKFRMYLDSDLNTQLGLYKIFEHANGWVGNGDEVYVAIGTLSKDIYSPFDKKPVFTSEYRKEPEEEVPPAPPEDVPPAKEDTSEPPAEGQENPQPEEPSVEPGQEENVPPVEGEQDKEVEQPKEPAEDVPVVEETQPTPPVESNPQEEQKQEQQRPSESVDEKQENV